MAGRRRRGVAGRGRVAGEPAGEQARRIPASRAIVARPDSRYGAVLAQARRIAGLDGLTATVHRGAVVIGPDEARLLAERPPHSLLH